MTAKRYIFTFKEGTKENSPEALAAKEFIKSQGKSFVLSAPCGNITHDFGETGFTAEVPDKSGINAQNFGSNPLLGGVVDFVEEDGVVTTQ